MFFLLKLLGIGKAIIGWAKSFAGWLFQSWERVAIAAALLVAAFFWLQAGKATRAYERALVTLEARNKTIYDMTVASDAARTAQIAMNQANTDKQNEIVRLTDETSKIRGIAIRDASSRYADNNRLSKVCAANSSATDPTAKDRASEGDDGLQASAIMVSQSDFDVLNARTADAIRYEDWARSLVGAGLAIEAN